jgi:hypothetical protein
VVSQSQAAHSNPFARADLATLEHPEAMLLGLPAFTPIA